jgi:CHAD domain-containing protein
MAWSVGVRPVAPAPAAVPQAALQPASQPVSQPLLSAEQAAQLAPVLAPKPKKLPALVSQRLRKWHRRLTADGDRFHQLQDEQRHSLRKLAKRLRYALSFTESLNGANRVKPYRQHLSQLQDVLGDINDLVVARAHYPALTDTHPQAWFALGWIAARLEELYVRAEACFKELARTRPFWK